MAENFQQLKLLAVSIIAAGIAARRDGPEFYPEHVAMDAKRTFEAIEKEVIRDDGPPIGE